MRVLVVDDEENVRKGIATFLELSGHEATAVADLAAARAALTAEARVAPTPESGDVRVADGGCGGAAAFQAALVDLYVGSENGADLLDFAAERRLGTPVIMMSGKGSVKVAVAALRKGAYDFLEKPLDTDRLLAILRNLERESVTLRRLEAFRENWLKEHVYMEDGSALAAAFETARRSAASPLSVLISGPTGSGKELVARWIHLCSPRSQGPFVAVNCAAIPPELAQSAFFGSLKGAYTGASQDRKGYFEAASGGTLFLDEVGELDMSLQATLLRAVETGEIQSVGAEKSSRSDARIVAATNRELRAETGRGTFREDLYWRLAQVRVFLPPLAERRGEIRGLAHFLASSIRERMGVQAPGIGEDALAWLEGQSWPGNVRELRAFLERALWLAPPRSTIGARYLASLQTTAASPPGSPAGPPGGPGSHASREAGEAAACGAGALASAGAVLGADGSEVTASLAEAKEAFERAYVGKALEAAGGSVARAAEILGLLPNNLSRKLKELGLR